MSAQVSIEKNGANEKSAVSYPLTREQEDRSYEVDVFSQLRANLNQLEELNARLGFMVNEVVGLIKKK